MYRLTRDVSKVHWKGTMAVVCLWMLCIPGPAQAIQRDGNAAGDTNELFWLKAAEREARKHLETADEGKLGDTIGPMKSVVGAAAFTGNVTFGRRVIASVPREYRGQLANLFAYWLASHGHLDAAVAEARRLDDSETWLGVCIASVRHDWKRGKTVLKMVPSRLRDPARVELVEAQLHDGQYGEAKATYDAIKKKKYRGDASKWLSFYEAIRDGRALPSVAQRIGSDLDDDIYKVRIITEGFVERGKLEKARAAAASLASPNDRCRTEVDIARYCWKREKKRAYRQAIQNALAEAEKVDDDFSAQLRYADIAHVLAKAGDVDAARTVLRKYARAEMRYRAARGDGAADAEIDKEHVELHLGMVLLSADKPELVVKVCDKSEGIVSGSDSYLVEAYGMLGKPKKIARMIRNTTGFSADPWWRCELYIRAASGTYRWSLAAKRTKELEGTE